MTEIKHLPFTKDPEVSGSEEAESIQLYSPTGEYIIGSLEKLSGVAHTTFWLEADGTVTFAFTGETEVFWDSQTTKEHPGGDVVWLDRAGEEWRFAELKATPPRFRVGGSFGAPFLVDTRTDRKLSPHFKWRSAPKAAAQLNRLQHKAELYEQAGNDAFAWDLTPEMVEKAVRHEFTRQQAEYALILGVLKDER